MQTADQICNIQVHNALYSFPSITAITLEMKTRKPEIFRTMKLLFLKICDEKHNKKKSYSE